MAYTINFYNEEDEFKWDDFVLYKSMNGTFLQTRKFISYHQKGKFNDCSLCIRKGNDLVATVLACEVIEAGKRTFFSHKGTTFGGICITKSAYTASAVSDIMDTMLQFVKEQGFEKMYLKMVPDIYQRNNANLLDYFLYKNEFQCFDELNYYFNLDRYKVDVTAPFTYSKRRDYRYSLKNELEFRRLDSKEEIAAYYDVLKMNFNKLGLHAVHSLTDLYDLKFNRFNELIEFYGVFKEKKIIAGAMLFYFGNDIVHTQYLSSNEQYLKLFSMDFLICNLIQIAVNKGMRLFTLGISTENQGRHLNLGLSRFKEQFGTEFCINRSYEKALC